MTSREKDKLSLTMYPMTPMTRKPTPTAWDIFANSRASAACVRCEVNCGQMDSTFCASVDELLAVAEKVAGHVGEFFELIGHCWDYSGLCDLDDSIDCRENDIW